MQRGMERGAVGNVIGMLNFLRKLVEVGATPYVIFCWGREGNANSSYLATWR